MESGIGWTPANANDSPDNDVDYDYYLESGWKLEERFWSYDVKPPKFKLPSDNQETRTLSFGNKTISYEYYDNTKEARIWTFDSKGTFYYVYKAVSNDGQSVCYAWRTFRVTDDLIEFSNAGGVFTEDGGQTFIEANEVVLGRSDKVPQTHPVSVVKYLKSGETIDDLAKRMVMVRDYRKAVVANADEDRIKYNGAENRKKSYAQFTFD